MAGLPWRDTATKLEEFAINETLRKVRGPDGKAESIEDYGYGKGYQFVFDTFRNVLGDFDAHIRAGRNVILIAHDCTQKVPNPEGEDWIRYEPRLQTTAGGKASIRLALKEWSDHVLFLSYDVAVDKKKKAAGSGTRTLYTSELPHFMAKSRSTNESFAIDEPGKSPWEEIF